MKTLKKEENNGHAQSLDNKIMVYTPFSKKKKSFTLFLVLSIFVHVLIAGLFQFGFKHWAEKEKKSDKTFWVELKKLKETPQTIVDIPKPSTEKIPDKPSAQSLYNQSVKEEEVAPTPPSPSKEQKKTAEQKTPTKEPLKKSESKNQSQENYGVKQPTQHIPGMPEDVAEQQTRAYPDDYLPYYKVGGRTYLNTLANPNIAYFVELKSKFRLTFNPVPSIRGRINEIAQGKISVVLGVSVNSRGELASLITIRSSGLGGYDAEAQRTIRDSAPFSAPPSNLLENDGMLNMAWTFVVYL